MRSALVPLFEIRFRIHIGLQQGLALPPRYRGSTMGAGGLNFRVRNGNGCDSTAIATGKN